MSGKRQHRGFHSCSGDTQEQWVAAINDLLAQQRC